MIKDGQTRTGKKKKRKKKTFDKIILRKKIRKKGEREKVWTTMDHVSSVDWKETTKNT